ncbi:DGQHR domain-containing protein [Mesorhizobium sp. M0601]|uniref:DGQHR domain-containing protein n=1 Tax=Mesorhizobium sp. M0601 TaxID=2956969 RepID=UPI0033395C6C
MNIRDMGTNQIEKLSDACFASTRSERISEYKNRKQAFDYQRVSPASVEEFKSQGWEFDRSLKTGTRLRRAKSSEEMLENRFWSVLYLLGFERLNLGHDLALPIEADGGRTSKTISVLGIDEDTIVVAECRTAESLKRKSPFSVVADLDVHKRSIANTLRRFLGEGSNRKIIWCVVTAHIRWADGDLEKAKEKQVHVLREQELRYFQEIAKTLGRAAKHQFVAEFLSGQKIPALANRHVSASKFKLGGRTAYAFTIPAKDLLRRAFVNHRDLRDPSGAPSYQRLIDSRRIKAIAAFLSKGGYFANSIIVSFHTPVRFDQKDRDEDADVRFGKLYLPDSYKTCWVIDGQHRLYGASLMEEGRDPIIPVVAFEKLPATEEAILFTTINKEQKQVQPRLLDELDGELKWNSDDPEESAGGIAARSLDQLRHEIAGPFEDRFAPPGVPATKNQVLTLPQVKQALLKSGLLGRRSNRDDSYLPGALTGGSRKSTLENTSDFLSGYFSAVRAANVPRWEGGPQQLLCYNPAIQAHLRLCGEVVRHFNLKLKLDPHEMEPQALVLRIVEFGKSLFDFISDSSDEAFKERFYVPFGSGGPARYFYKAAELVSRDHTDFEPDGLKEYLAGTNKELREECDRLVSWITDEVHSFVVRRLKEQYGSDFFNAGIKNKEIKKKAYEKSLDDPTGAKPLETYLDLLELKKIVESSENWPFFKESLNFPLPIQPKGLAKNLIWLEDFNEVRKVWAHPYNRAYSEEDVALLKFIESELRKRLI